MASRRKVVPAFKCDPNFCHVCGTILALPGLEDAVKCQVCGFKHDVELWSNIEIQSSKTFNEEKLLKRNALREDSEALTSDGPVVKRKCPKCGYHKMSYTTRQTRSADEGQTVFYSCVKCKFSESEFS